jgi:hypothetical protein
LLNAAEILDNITQRPGIDSRPWLVGYSDEVYEHVKLIEKRQKISIDFIPITEFAETKGRCEFP